MKTLNTDQEQYLTSLVITGGWDAFNADQFNAEMQIDPLEFRVGEHYDMGNLLAQLNVNNEYLQNDLTLAHFAAAFGQRRMLEHLVDIGSNDSQEFSLLHAAIAGLNNHMLNSLTSLYTLDFLLDKRPDLIDDINHMSTLGQNQDSYSAFSLYPRITHGEFEPKILQNFLINGAKIAYTNSMFI